MKISRLRPALCAGAIAIGTLSSCPVANAIDVPLPETEMPALASLVASALAKSPRTMARDFDLLSAQYDEMVSSSGLYPHLGGNYQYQVREEDRGNSTGRHVINRTYYNLTLSQAVWYWGAVRAAARVGELGTMIARQNLEGARRGLALEVRDSYLSLIMQKMGVRNAQFSENLLKEALVRQEARYKASEITMGVLADARLRADEAELTAQKGASDLEFAIRAFRRLTGVDSFSEADIPDAIRPPVADPSPVAPGEQTGYLKSEALLVSELQIEQGKLNDKINRKALWPKLSALAGVSQDDNLYSATVNQRITNDITFVGVQVQWTIFDGFASRGRRLQNLTRLRQLEEARADLLDTLKNSADQQAANVGFAWSAYKNAHTRHNWAIGSVAFEKDNLKRGQSSEENVASAQANLNRAEFTANDALAKFYSASARYASTMHADPLFDGANNN